MKNVNANNIPSYSFSHHVYPGYIEFSNPFVQEIWEKKFLPDFTPFLPSHIDLIVDIIHNETSNGETLRLLAIYDSSQKVFHYDREKLILFGYHAGFFLDCYENKAVPIYSKIS